MSDRVFIMNADPESPAALVALCPAHAATPLLDLPRLAAALQVASLSVKDEGRRPLGSFKALGGVYAGLRALARAAGVPTRALLDPARVQTPLPALVCASAGNHGLSVASAARLAGASARGPRRRQGRGSRACRGLIRRRRATGHGSCAGARRSSDSRYKRRPGRSG